MSRPPRAGDRRRLLERRSNPAIIPGLLALVLIAAAVAVAFLSREPSGEPAPSPSAPKPFADLPPETEPPPGEPQTRSGLPPAPAGLASEPVWVEAAALAAEGRVLFDAAVAAKAKDELALAREQAAAAHAKYDKAVEQTAEWEERVLAQYDARDARVRAIRSERSDWLNKLRWLAKTAKP